MALIVALDPGGARSAALDEVRRLLAAHEFAVVDSPDAAIAALDRRTPAVVLLPSELLPADTNAICAHLHARAGHAVPTLLLPAIDDVGSASDPRAIAAEVENALREPLIAAARALVSWVRARADGGYVPLDAPAPAWAAVGASAPAAPPDAEGAGEPGPAREPWLGPALASIGRGASAVLGSAAGGAGAAIGAAASPILRWAPRLLAAAAVVAVVAYAGVTGRPYVMERIDEFRNRPAAQPADAPAPAAQPAAAPVAGPTPRDAVAGSTIPGWAAVFAPFEIVASEGGRVVRIDERNEIMLSPGPHEITFRNERFGFQEVHRIDIEPAKTTRISIVPPRSSISISANMPAEVWVDGEPVGQTPLLDLPADLGTREVRLRNADGVERRQMVIVTVAPVAVDVDFSRP